VLRSGAGSQWDPQVVQVLVEEIRRPIERVQRALSI